ncbi:hypothetical protein ACW5R3_08510 [Bizionia sp. KMM 8389]
MKTTFITSLFLVGFLVFSYAQESSKTHTIKKYMTLKSYQLAYKKPLTKQDSLNLVYRENDTLVLITDNMVPKSVSVPYEFKSANFLNYYKKIAFRTTGIDSVDKSNVMRYWKDPIRIYFSKSISKKVKKDLMSLAKSISSKVDSLNISEVKNIEESNYVIYYFDDYEYDLAMKNYKYTDYYLHWNNKNQVYRCGLKVNRKLFFNDRLISEKLKELFVGSLGHFKLSDDFSCESYLSNCQSENKQLTELDIALLQYHYSYGICKGTDLESFEEQHEKAKSILKEHNTLINFMHID